MRDPITRVQREAAAVAFKRWRARENAPLDNYCFDAFIARMHAADNATWGCAVGDEIAGRVRYNNADWCVSFAGIMPTDVGPLCVVELYLDEYEYDGDDCGRSNSTCVHVWAVDRQGGAALWALYKAPREVMMPVIEAQ